MRTLLVQTALRDGELTVTGDEAHHALRVLRLGIGDQVRLCDGQGGVAAATVALTTKASLGLRVGPVASHPPGAMQQLTLALAPPKGGRLDDCVRMLTELGMGRIALLATQRGERLPGPSGLERCARIAAEALKQCRRAWMPEIGPVWDIQTLARQAADGSLGRVHVLDPAGVIADPGKPVPSVLVVGPEGGLTMDERQTLAAAGATEVCVSEQVLRIETAAVAAAACWGVRWLPAQGGDGA